MSSLFKCEHCGKFLEATYEQQNQQLPCPYCGEDIVVPIDAGPCPKCSKFLEDCGRRWHISMLILFFGGIFSASLIFIALEEKEGLKALIMGLLIGIFSVLSCSFFLKQRIYKCPACKTFILIRTWKKLQWSENLGEDTCPVCKEKFTNIKNLYVGTAFLLILVAVYFIYTGILGNVEFVVKLFEFLTAGIIIWMAVKRWSCKPWKCKKCNMLVVYR